MLESKSQTRESKSQTPLWNKNKRFVEVLDVKWQNVELNLVQKKYSYWAKTQVHAEPSRRRAWGAILSSEAVYTLMCLRLIYTSLMCFDSPMWDFAQCQSWHSGFFNAQPYHFFSVILSKPIGSIIWSNTIFFFLDWRNMATYWSCVNHVL